MPNISALDYQLTHYNTISTAMWRKVKPIPFVRHRLELADGDFMDLDLWQQQNAGVAILVHGLEGDAYRPYMLGMAHAMHSVHLDTVNVNLRGCSGAANRLLKTYHSGSTDDLQSVIEYVQTNFEYKKIVLIGFSLGGNIVLKYTGDHGAVGISTPCDLTSCANAIKERKNFLYMYRFMHNLREKIDLKKDMLPPDMDYDQLKGAKNFHEFDHWFTAKANGFDSAAHYWETCSSKPGLSKVAIPTLLINAQDDTFLGKECYPSEIAEEHDLFYMMAPKYGGHVGFSGDDREGMLWSEYQVAKFVSKHL